MAPDTLLHRQINPSWIQEGRVSSQAFLPTQKDEGLLSTYRGDLTAPEEAWRHFNFDLGRSSVGILGVQVSECSSIGLQARPDPTEFPEHAVIDFNGYGTKENRRKASILRGNAEARGWLFEFVS